MNITQNIFLYKNIIDQWNNRHQVNLKNKTIINLFEEQVEKTPDKTLLTYFNEKLSYNEINIKANQLARYIKRIYKKCTHKELTSNDSIAISCPKSDNLVVSVLGVMKAGGAFVYIDPTLSHETINHILTDCKSSLILTDYDSNDIIEETVKRNSLLNKNLVVNMDSIMYGFEDDSNLNLSLSLLDRACTDYILRTNTLPEKVNISNQNIINLDRMNSVLK